MIHDSSSSEEEEDFTEFDPRAIHAQNVQHDIPVIPLDDEDDDAMDTSDLSMEQADKSMETSWANFDAPPIAYVMRF